MLCLLDFLSHFYYLNNMNLYKIKFTHYSPKDSKEGIFCFLLASNGEEVYEWMKNNDCKVEGYEPCNFYFDDHEQNYDINYEGEPFEWSSMDYKQYSGTYKEMVIYFQGEDHPYQEYTDLFYGKTIYGWECLEIDTTKDYSPLIDLELCFVAK